MSSWGLTDNATIAGTVYVATANANAVLGVSTYFTVNVKAGDYLSIAGNKYQVGNVLSNTIIYLTSNAATNSAGVAAYLQTGPKYLMNVNQSYSGRTVRQQNLQTIQNVYGVTFTEMHTNRFANLQPNVSGTGYFTNVVANTTITIATTGASQPSVNATATLNFVNNTLSSVTLTNAGSGYGAAQRSNTTAVIATSGAIQPSVNATVILNFTQNSTASNATHTGWNTFISYLDAFGNPRYKEECLVTLSKNFTNTSAGDNPSDDATFPN
ncbi:MAG: hypothetical protein ACO294_07575 [Methylococcales bacterium]